MKVEFTVKIEVEISDDTILPENIFVANDPTDVVIRSKRGTLYQDEYTVLSLMQSEVVNVE